MPQSKGEAGIAIERATGHMIKQGQSLKSMVR